MIHREFNLVSKSKKKLSIDNYDEFFRLAEEVCEKALKDDDLIQLSCFDIQPGFNLKEEGDDYFIINHGKKNAEASMLAHFGYKTIINLENSPYAQDPMIIEFMRSLKQILDAAKQSYIDNFKEYSLIKDDAIDYIFDNHNLEKNLIFIRFIKYLPVTELRRSIGKPHLDRGIATLHLHESHNSFLHLTGIEMDMVPDTKYFDKLKFQSSYPDIKERLFDASSVVQMDTQDELFFLGAGYANLNNTVFDTSTNVKLGYHTVITSDIGKDIGIERRVLIAFLLPRVDISYTYFRPTTLFSRRLDLYVDPKANQVSNTKSEY